MNVEKEINRAFDEFSKRLKEITKEMKKEDKPEKFDSKDELKPYFDYLEELFLPSSFLADKMGEFVRMVNKDKKLNQKDRDFLVGKLWQAILINLANRALPGDMVGQFMSSISGSFDQEESNYHY